MVRLALFAALLIGLPFYVNPMSGEVLFDSRWLLVFRVVGLFIILGIGLNIVVGYAGLLDLGYVAFFASGAYLYALLASPRSPAIDFPIDSMTWFFWVALPLALVLGAVVGVILGVPVMPLRGDYLAIVTLGFGEIIRLFLVNQRNFTGGSQGLPNLQAPPLPDLTKVGLPGLPVDQLGVGAHKEWYFIIMAFAFLAAFCAGRLRDSRIGRAWEAIREDEDVAASMGVNTIKYKLLAFAMGAAIGAVGGTLFAGFRGAALPDSFTLLVSINVISIVVIGGMGSTPGVVLGAFILVGIPDILRFKEAADFLGLFNPLVPFYDTSDLAPWRDRNRLMVFGALLVTVIVLRPTGLLPSRRRKMKGVAGREAAGA